MNKKSLLLILAAASSLVGLCLTATTKASVCSHADCTAHPKDDRQILLPKKHIAQLKYTELYEKARLITVKVIVQNTSQGSGIIIQRQGQDYTVLTNQHVAKGETSYQIETSSGKKYEATRIEKSMFGRNDLAILQFKTEEESEYHQIADFGDSFELREKDQVFAAGYPADGKSDYEGGFVLDRGRVLLRLKKPLRLGYQIGSTNNFEKGMSGGPLINEKGEVVGISGRHQPLWGGGKNCIYRYEDNSPACDQIDEVISEERIAGVTVAPNSWTIPIEIFLEQAPKKLGLKQPSPFWVAIKEKEKADLEWQKARWPENWSVVVKGWSQAIEFLEEIPATHPKYVEAQGKIEKYKKNLDYARDMAEKSKAAPEGLADPYYEGISQVSEIWRTAQMTPEAARTPEYWRDIAALWGEALRFMEAVPDNHPLYQEAEKKKREYRKNFTYSQQRASGTK